MKVITIENTRESRKFSGELALGVFDAIKRAKPGDADFNTALQVASLLVSAYSDVNGHPTGEVSAVVGYLAEQNLREVQEAHAEGECACGEEHTDVYDKEPA